MATSSATSVNEVYRARSRAIHFSCAVLFMAFTFALLYGVKGELLAYAQHAWSGGVTHYNLLVGALIITVVLQGVQWVCSWLLPLPLAVHALTYLPSALLLAMLTNISPEAVAHFHMGSWAWIAPAVLIVYILVSLALRRVLPRTTFLQSCTSNAVVLLLLIVLAAGIDRTPDTLLYELRQERLIRQGRYAEAARVGEYCLEPTRRMTTLRAYALSRCGQLPQRLLDMPQPYGPDGLLCISDTLHRLRRVDTQDICAWLGAYAGPITIHSPRTDATDRYLHLLRDRQTALVDSLRRDSLQPTSRIRAQQQRTLDYTLCRLLLARRVDEFTRLLPQYAALNPTDTFPSLYAQALCLADTSATPFRPDTTTLQRFRAYQQMRDTIHEPLPRRNLTRRQWGNTFWWYYDNPLPADTSDTH